MSDEDMAREWASEAFDRNQKPISDSSLFMMMFSGSRDDALQCLQLGMAIMMNKPIIVMADGSIPIPKNLERVAVRVARADFNDPEKLGKIIKEITDETDPV